jgi:hypothetical protein
MDWLMATAIVLIFLGAIVGPAVARRDLEARIDTTHGTGRRWRRALLLQFWGIWAYWLVADRRLPPAA